MAEWKKVIVSGSDAILNTVTASAFKGDGSALTGVAAGSLDIDNFSALGSATVAQADNILISDGGTEKKVTFSNFEDSIFGNVSSDVTIAAGGAATIAADAVTFAKMQNISSNNVILGNDDGTNQAVQELTGANVRTIINVEDGADVTDATNVTAAGALMDSEVTSLALVKALTAAGITGSFGAASASFSTRVTANDSKLTANTSNVTSAGAVMDSEVTNLAFVKALAKGISDGNVLTANDAVADDDFLRINGTEVEGLSVSEVLTALSVESGADVTDTANVTSAGALMDSELTDLAGVKGVTISTLQSKPSEGAFANGDKTKLDGIAAGAQVNVSGDSGNAAIYDNSGTPAFKSGITKAEVLSILNVEDGADVTDTTNVTSAGALMDSEVTNLSFVKGLTKGISDGNVLTANDVVADDDFLRINGTEVEGLTAAETRTALNVEDGSTADQTAIEIINLLNSDLGGDKQIGNQSDDKMTFGGSVTVTGDLQVNGTTTSVNSTTVNIGDNILELNYAGTAADAGILVKDAVGGAGVSGSLLWDASEDYWVAGALGSEARVVVGTGTAGDIVKFSSAGVVTDSILSESGTTLTIANDVIVSGLTASQLVVTNGSKQLVSSTDISSLTLTLDGGQF